MFRPSIITQSQALAASAASAASADGSRIASQGKSRIRRMERLHCRAILVESVPLDLVIKST